LVSYHAEKKQEALDLIRNFISQPIPALKTQTLEKKIPTIASQVEHYTMG